MKKSNLTNEEQEKLLLWIKQQPLIRIPLSGAPGFGVEKHTLTIYRWLREQGYQATVEIIYQDGNEMNNVEADIATLLGLPVKELEATKPYQIDEQTLLISRSYFDANADNFSTCFFGISGERRWRNPLEIFKLTRFIWVSIHNLAPEYSLHLSEEQSINCNPNLCENLPMIAALPIKVKTKKELLTIAESVRHQVINYLLENINLQLISLYGLNEKFIKYGECHPEVVLKNLIGAYRQAKKNKSVYEEKKSSVVFIFMNDFTDETSKKLEDVCIEKKISYADLRVTNAENIRMPDFSNDGWHVLNIGSLSSEVFDYLISISKLFIAEGHSAQNIAAQTGVPFLHRDDLPIGEYKRKICNIEKIAPPLIQKQLAMGSMALIRPEKMAISQEKSNIEILANFIQAIDEPASEINQFFKDLKQQVSQNNVLLIALADLFQRESATLNMAVTTSPVLTPEPSKAMEMIIQDNIGSNQSFLPYPTLFQEGEFFDNWEWQESLDKHSGMPFFIFTAFKNGLKVGTVFFDGEPTLCRYDGENKSNIIYADGIFSHDVFNIEPDKINTICQHAQKVESPTMDWLFVVQNGVAGGIANTLRRFMAKNGHPNQISNLVREVSYYSLLFCSTALLKYYQSADEDFDSIGRETFLMVLQVCLANFTFGTINHGLTSMHDWLLKKPAISPLIPSAVKKLASVANYGAFIVHGVRLGFFNSMCSLAVGALTQKTTEIVAEKTLEAVNSSKSALKRI